MPQGKEGSGEGGAGVGADADYGIFGVRAERTQHPIAPPPVDRQRVYKGLGERLAMDAKPRFKNSGGASLNRTSPGGFRVRKRTLKG